MRPSCPPPSTPSVAPGSTIRFTAARLPAPSGVCASRNALRRARQLGPRRGQDGRRPAGRRSWRPACRWPAWPPARRPASARSTAASRGRCSAALCTGTPSTGSMVCAATMPGRWAAPPAPAMITFRPWRLGALREFRHPRRRAVGRHDLLEVGHAELVEHGSRVRHRVPVGLRSHDHGDERCWHVGGSGKRTAYQNAGLGARDQGSGTMPALHEDRAGSRPALDGRDTIRADPEVAAAGGARRSPAIRPVQLAGRQHGLESARYTGAMSMRCFALAGLAAAACLGSPVVRAQTPAAAPAPSATRITVAYQEFTLTNGLDVILHATRACRSWR